MLSLRTTKRPAMDEPQYPREIPPPYRRPVPQVQQASQPRAFANAVSCELTPRVTFWIAAAMALPVWFLSVSATLDDDWFENVPRSSFDKYILEQCADDNVRAATNDFCDLYFSFMVIQLVATIWASVALALLSMALFVTASGWCCSVKALGFGGGYSVAVSALFQLVAIVLVFRIAQGDIAYFSDDNDAFNGEGSTFWVAMIGFIFALFDAIFLLVFLGSAGDGLFYEWIGKVTTPKR